MPHSARFWGFGAAYPEEATGSAPLDVAMINLQSTDQNEED